MSKDRIVIRFHNLYELWQFAQAIHATSIEVRTSELLLVCNCSDEEAQLAAQFGGTVMTKETVNN